MSKRQAALRHNSQSDENKTDNKPVPLPFLHYPLDQWTTDNIAEYFTRENLSQLARKFKGDNISGIQLLGLTHQDLAKIDITSEEDRVKTLKIMEEIQTSAMPELKLCNDPIHGHIELHPLCVKIIDTPEFQRLRFIKQLGACYFVYPGASHNRFEHSLGVCHLAGELVRAIKKRQPELNISSRDILCVEIAGLCHDLGHGPFSHLFDGRFIPQAYPDGFEWKHEKASVQMFDHLVKKNKLDAEFTKYGLTEDDQVFIKEQIEGPPSKDPDEESQEEESKEEESQEEESGEEWPYKGRDKKKGFLYEVVANKRNCIDVDKWDYFARDCHNLGIGNNFDHQRFMKFARVLEVDNELQICSRDKEVQTLYDMFNTRATLHKRAYQHRVNVIIEHMITEAFLKADKYLKFPGSDGKFFTMSQSIKDMESYSKLNDCVFDRIVTSVEPELQEARDILTKVLQRKLYKCVGQTKPTHVVYKRSDMKVIKKEIVAQGQEKDRQALEDNLIVELMTIDYGMKTGANPIDHVRFYDKRNPKTPMVIRKEEVSRMMPKEFKDQNVCLFTRTNDPEFYQIAMETFKLWCENKKFSSPRGGSFASTETTPYKRQNSGTEERVSKKARQQVTKNLSK